MYKTLVQVLYTADKDYVAETSCNQLLIATAMILLTINLPTLKSVATASTTLMRFKFECACPTAIGISISRGLHRPGEQL